MYQKEQEDKFLRRLIECVRNKEFSWTKRTTLENGCFWETSLPPYGHVSIQEPSHSETPGRIRYYWFPYTPLDPIIVIPLFKNNYLSIQLFDALTLSDYRHIHAEDELRKLIERWGG